ncbi:nuclear transport factor 2 family protein [Chryseobacterium sp. PBS4-4]|uniref:Nuclear transport factor 2 family protein n=1 Tax=Chryseobacterium edaphi TaxID=2976532 RepID=A0ABT2W4T2_9FLAO|nr:nuclear transport factor 2 family protein [Chryseobacterium edaphi]MCU7616232.1 nuclear transport factor 2 family protein [Chryseobacterium edaphi]
MENQTTTMQEVVNKFAITETLYRFAAGLDQKNLELLSSAFATDAISDFRPAGKKAGFEYPVLEGRETIVNALRGSLSKIDTTHSISNPLISFNGEEAKLDVLVEAQHVPTLDHTKYYLMKNRYDVKLIKENENWVIKHVIIDNVWRTGDSTVLTDI